MKKYIIFIIPVILLCIFYGKYIFGLYENDTKPVIKTTDEIVYIIQSGAYSSEANAKQYSSNLNYYVIEKDDKYYRVYVGITQNKEYSDKIKGIYNDMGENIYVWEKNINDSAFLEILKQYDTLLEGKESKEDIVSIETQVLGKYEELVIRKNELSD